MISPRYDIKELLFTLICIMILMFQMSGNWSIEGVNFLIWWLPKMEALWWELDHPRMASQKCWSRTPIIFFVINSIYWVSKNWFSRYHWIASLPIAVALMLWHIDWDGTGDGGGRFMSNQGVMDKSSKKLLLVHLPIYVVCIHSWCQNLALLSTIEWLNDFVSI